MVAGNDSVAANTAEVAKENFTRLGFNVRLRVVSPEVMYTKFCNVPAANVDICPNVSWILDFADGQTMLDPTFNGKNILPQNNSNWSQLDVPKINAAMGQAELLTDPEERASAWATIDKLVTAYAPGILYVWDKTPVIKSSNVHAAASASNGGFLDYTFTRLK
jgi:peptide/nickel transport system substrate-binding protein